MFNRWIHRYSPFKKIELSDRNIELTYITKHTYSAHEKGELILSKFV